MKKQLSAVEEFHNAFGQENGKVPRLIKEEEGRLRFRLMAEENEEYLVAVQAGDLVEIADALGDQLYILCGTILKHGMQNVIEQVFDEIQASNMSKLGADGKPVLREDGKILKGPGFFRPDLAKFLKED
jgi:predicted HAD superfamily Cof-like phosphohydrolase